jgi:hypothetical protein
MIVLRYIPLRLGAEARLDRASSPGRVMDRPDNCPLLTVAFRPMHSSSTRSSGVDRNALGGRPGCSAIAEERNHEAIRPIPCSKALTASVYLGVVSKIGPTSAPLLFPFENKNDWLALIG